ncbi:MAG: hypothetical protein JW910_17520 [Anaerolineae bacterium]|nr:hypothetical protein [Anaerolineae bacterium]
MNDQEKISVISQGLHQGSGILRLVPTWVPRSFNAPGRRLRLDPRDLYPFGGNRGGICERWLGSTTKADNGPLTTPDEGLSYLDVDGARVQLREAFALAGPDLLGQETLDAGGWVVLNKLLDYLFALPFHMHQNDTAAAVTGQLGKPEAYYFPPQYNQTPSQFPYTFFGLEPGTTQDEVITCLKRWNEGDNRILSLSKAYQLEVGTGWNVNPGVLHAPGAMVTYEPQRASDVFSMWQSLVAGVLYIDRAMLVKDVPPEYHEDYDYLISLLDWETNVDPAFKRTNFTPPTPARPVEEMESQGYGEHWVTYGGPYFSAKELTVQPGRTVTLAEAGAYGVLCVQGYGTIGPHTISAPTQIRFGAMTEDEFFVSHDVAQDGVVVTNRSASDPLVLLKYFNAGNPDMPGRD